MLYNKLNCYNDAFGLEIFCLHIVQHKCINYYNLLKVSHKDTKSQDLFQVKSQLFR